MALPAPDLDDRRFPDLVIEAMRTVSQRCPEWSDHSPSDPGVTLIEAFAFLTDQLFYRLNQVPERLQVKFLELIGLRLLPPTPARVPVTFWLSTPAAAAMTIAEGTEVATLRSEAEDSIVFTTTDDLAIVPCSVHALRTRDSAAETSAEQADPVQARTGFGAFSVHPEVGDTLLVGLDVAAPRCAVRLELDCHVEGIGVNPKRPPLVWEAWTGEGWTRCDVGEDETGGLNSSGGVVLHLPAAHAASLLDGQRAAWLRARVTEPDEGQPGYSASPIVDGLSAATVGITGDAVHAEIVADELLGRSEGVAGQTFELLSRPVLGGMGDPVVEVSSTGGWQEWTPVTHFAASGPTDRHFLLDAVPGEVVFGPAVRLDDGTVRQHGAVAEKDASVRIRRYATGGGTGGNVGAGTIRTLKSSIPFVAEVENRYSAQGGRDGETLAEAKARGPLLLRTRGRAVTTEDYEALAREAVPEAARIRAIPAGTAGVPAGAVKVLVVPAAAQEHGRISFADLLPSQEVLDRLSGALEAVRLVGTTVQIEPPRYRGVTVVARLIARPRVPTARIRADALDALHTYLNPLPGGGIDGTGWPFGRAVRTGDVYAVLSAVRGVDFVEDVRLFTANPVTGERGSEQSKVELEANSLVFSFEHQIRVEEH
jgi:predicted phage baseplate assembly protein